MKSQRQTVTRRIAALVREASESGRVLNAKTEGFRLLAEFPECGLSVEELAEEVADRAANAGVVVET